jgi:NhaP-type Na+/H+ or K+/H+ antiporter
MATISTYNKLGLKVRQPLLHTLVLGEATINAAVAIILFTLINVHSQDNVHSRTVGLLISISLFGSIALGVVLSCLLIFLMGCCNMHGREKPLMLSFLGSAFLVFSVAESYEMSGIIANMVAGIVFRRYGARLLTDPGERSTTEMFDLFASLTESLVFVLVGAIASLIADADGFTFGLWAVLLCLVARGVAVPACAAISNTSKNLADQIGFKRPNMITWEHQFAMWNSGLRGGVSLFLALELNPEWCGLPKKLIIVEGTFVVIVVLLVLEGISTEWLLGFLGMTHDKEGDGADKQSTEVGEGQWGTQWATQVVDFLEPVVLGGKDQLEERVKGGALEE